MPVEKQVLLQRLHTSEGHLRAISGMLEDDEPCQQVLHQLNAVQCAIEAVGSLLLQMEVERCLRAIRDNPCPEQRCEQLARLVNLYPLFKRFTFKFYEVSAR